MGRSPKGMDPGQKRKKNKSYKWGRGGLSQRMGGGSKMGAEDKNLTKKEAGGSRAGNRKKKTNLDLVSAQKGVGGKNRETRRQPPPKQTFMNIPRRQRKL